MTLNHGTAGIMSIGVWKESRYQPEASARATTIPRLRFGLVWVVLAVCLSLGRAAAIQGQGRPPSQADQVPSLDSGWLAHVRDDTPFGNWRLIAPEEIPAEERDEERVFWQAVLAATRTPAEAFAQAALNQRHLTFGHLYAEPAKYRGQVVHIEGRLARLKQLDPPHWIQLKDIHVLFEAWIYLNQPGTHPVCVLLPHQPDGIEPGDGLNHRVAVDGYFFKRYRYISGRLDQAGKNVPLNTVLLIAPNAKLITAAGPARDLSSAPTAGWTWLVGAAMMAVLLMVGLVWWLRRGDRQVRIRLDAMKNEGQPCVAPGHR